MRFSWPADITPDDGGFHIRFPDVPGAHSWGSTRAEALARGADALVSILSSMIEDGEPIPKASPARGREMVSLRPLDPAKVALHAAMCDRGLSKAQLGRLLQLDEKAVRRLLDPLHSSKIESVDEALTKLGRTIELSVVETGAARRARVPLQRNSAADL